MFLKSEGMKSNDKETAKDAEEFAQLYRESWKFDIALTQLEQSKWNPPQLLPFTKDVQNLHSHLSEKQLECLKDLKEEVSQSNWKDLAKVTLAQVILFNRRREGEVSRMPVSAYLSRDLSETHEDTTELDQLADFLGHNIEVHRKHYRLPEGTLQLAKISKVLLALEQGRIGEYKGKNLDEIHIDLPKKVARSEDTVEEAVEEAVEETVEVEEAVEETGENQLETEKRRGLCGAAT
ncbi:DNA primase [Dissostichus eleginoides]|uniref:DNA primase n=1 Tax=Dissostichus eleginoides TaxID=100907 RepID=A0AAD9CS73_DISEL|nr:DNA primase [Dissostichus eleginoides]